MAMASDNPLALGTLNLAAFLLSSFLLILTVFLLQSILFLWLMMVMTADLSYLSTLQGTDLINSTHTGLKSFQTHDQFKEKPSYTITYCTITIIFLAVFTVCELVRQYILTEHFIRNLLIEILKPTCLAPTVMTWLK